MSYSFTVRAASLAAALAAAAAEFDKIIETQPAHAKDKDAALVNAANVANCVGERAEHDVVIAMHGSVSWNTANPDALTACSASASVWCESRLPIEGAA